jgi:cytochrome c556
MRVLRRLPGDARGLRLALSGSMRLRDLLRGSLLGIALFSACASQTPANQPPQQAQLAQAIAAPDRRGPPEPLSPAAREILKTRMASHAHDMGELVQAIMLLDYPRISQLGNAIASDVNLSRPITGDATELNAALPEKFFVRQDELRAHARALAAAAQALDPYRVASEYGRLSEGCVRCHADYRPATQ